MPGMYKWRMASCAVAAATAGSRTRQPARGAVWRTARLLATVAILGVLATRLDGRALFRAVGSIRFVPWAAATCWMALASLLDAAAARKIFGALGLEWRFGHVLRVNYTGYFFALLGALPGGLARWAGMAGPQGRGAQALAGILLERYLRAAALLPLCVLAFLRQPAARFAPREHGAYLTGFALLGGALLLVAILAFGPRWSWARGHGTAGRASATARPLSPLRTLCRNLPRRRADWLLAWALLVLRALASTLTLVLLLPAAGVSLRGVDALWVASMTAMAQVVPLTVCGLGVREGMLVYLLAKHGAAPEQGLLIGLLWFWAAAALGIAGAICFLAGRGSARPRHPHTMPASDEN